MFRRCLVRICYIDLDKKFKRNITQCQGRSSRGARGDMSPALLETGDSVPRTFLTHCHNFHPCSLICYLDFSELTFSQSQGESSLGRICYELQISRCSRAFIHSRLCSLAVWGKMHPRKKQRFTSPFFQTHTLYVLCRDDMIHTIKFPCYDFTYSNHNMIF